jgi:hypothetical protein
MWQNYLSHKSIFGLHIHGCPNSYIPLPMRLSLPCRASSSQTVCGNWSGGVMATIPDWRPELIGPTPIRDWSSSWVSFKRFLNALRAALSSCWPGLCGCERSDDMRVSWRGCIIYTELHKSSLDVTQAATAGRGFMRADH